MDQLLSSALSKLDIEESRKNEENRKKLVKLLNDKISNGHTCTAWYRNLPEIADDELENTLETYSYDFEEIAERRDVNQSDLKYSSVLRLAKRCIQAFVNILFKNYDEVLPITAKAYKLIHDCINEKYFSEDYAEGFRYVVRALEIYLEIENGSVNSLGLVALQKFLDDLNSFDYLSLKNVVGVLAVKQYFIGNITRGCCEKQIDVIKEMITLDPTNCEWHNCLYAILSFYRENNSKNEPPSEEEKAVILAAINIPGAKSNPRILINEITCLAEVLRNDRKGSIVTPLRFGRNLFYSAAAVVRFIRVEADKILSIDPVSTRGNINIAKIFSSVLPFQFQDKEFAKSCIERALLYNPYSSKANHRMGGFYLTERDLPKALKYTKIAYEADKRNLFPLMDLLRLYMQEITKYKDELKSTFGEALNSSFHRKFPRNMSNLLFTSAIHKYLCSESREVIELILEAYTIDEKATSGYFTDIDSHAKRYKWYQNSQGKNILGGIHQLLSSAYSRCTDASKNAKLFHLLNAASAAEKISRNYYDFDGKGSSIPRDSRGSLGSQTGNRSRVSRGRCGDYRGNVDDFRHSGPRRAENSSFRGGFYTGDGSSNSCDNVENWRSGPSSENQSKSDQSQVLKDDKRKESISIVPQKPLDGRCGGNRYKSGN